MTEREPTIHELIERSSLGSAGAKRLRARTTDAQLARVRRLVTAAEPATSDTPRRSGGTGTLVIGAGPSLDPSHVGHDISEVSDADLIRRHVAGDPDAFAEVVMRHRNRMMAVAMRTLGDAEEATDALQDAFISAIRRADSYPDHVKVTTWLHRIVVNACLNRLRRRGDSNPS